MTPPIRSSPKRHTYSDRSLRLEIRTRWLADERTISRQTKAMWDWIGFEEEPGLGESRIRVPVRLASVLYALPPDIYQSVRTGVVPFANEFFCKMSSLGSWDAQDFKRFLRGMTYRERLTTSFYNKSS